MKYQEYLVTFTNKVDKRVYKNLVYVPISVRKETESIETLIISSLCELFPSTRFDNIIIEKVHNGPIKFKDMEFSAISDLFADYKTKEELNLKD
jgi:hypothetical protein